MDASIDWACVVVNSGTALVTIATDQVSPTQAGYMIPSLLIDVVATQVGYGASPTLLSDVVTNSSRAFSLML